MAFISEKLWRFNYLKDKFSSHPPYTLLNVLFPSNQGSISTSLEKNVASGVFRYPRDIGQTSTLGILYTGRAGKDYYNHVAGLDGYFQFSRTKSFRFQYLHSETKYPEDISLAFGQSLGAFGGDAFKAEFLHLGRNWQYGVEYEDLYPKFRADYCLFFLKK